MTNMLIKNENLDYLSKKQELTWKNTYISTKWKFEPEKLVASYKNSDWINRKMQEQRKELEEGWSLRKRLPSKCKEQNLIEI